METWYREFEESRTAKHPWMVKYLTVDDTVHEDQVGGENAQDVADYVRSIYGAETEIYFIARLDDSWT